MLLFSSDERDCQRRKYSTTDQGFGRLEVLQLHRRGRLQLRELLYATSDQVLFSHAYIYDDCFKKEA